MKDRDPMKFTRIYENYAPKKIIDNSVKIYH